MSGFYRSPDGQATYHIRSSKHFGSCASPALPGDNLDLGPRCGRIAPFLCDGPGPVRGRTCDAPMCEQHRTNVGPDRDLCPKHAPAKEAGTP